MDKKTVQPVTDDAELAKVLDSMKGDASGVPSGLSFEETPAPTAIPVTTDSAVPAVDPGLPTPSLTPIPQSEPAQEPLPPMSEPLPPSDDVSQGAGTDLTTTSSPADPVAATSPVPAPTSELDAIKRDAINELRPLVDKLNLPADEKFDTLLLLIRSTDDQALVPQAYAAARDIPDEAKRAQALLDVIKEIDFFAQQQK